MQQDFSKVPQELKNLPYWLTWKYVQKSENSKPTKAPNNRPSSWPNNLLTFSDVTNEYSKRILKNSPKCGSQKNLIMDIVSPAGKPKVTSIIKYYSLKKGFLLNQKNIEDISILALQEQLKNWWS